MIPSEEKRWRSLSCHKCKGAEHIYTVLTFQRATSSKVHVTSRRLYLQTRPERCIFFSSFRQGLKKNYSLPMRKKPLRVSVLC